jgi:hypothetical protein
MMATIRMVTPIVSGRALSSSHLRWLLKPGQLQKVINCGCLELIVTSRAFPDEMYPVPF